MALWGAATMLPQSGGAEQGVANCMAENVAVGMAYRAFFKGNFDATDH